jgi:hypothetical protein
MPVTQLSAFEMLTVRINLPWQLATQDISAQSLAETFYSLAA